MTIFHCWVWVKNQIKQNQGRSQRVGELRYLTLLLYFSAMIANNKGADQTARKDQCLYCSLRFLASRPM